MISYYKIITTHNYTYDRMDYYRVEYDLSPLGVEWYSTTTSVNKLLDMDDSNTVNELLNKLDTVDELRYNDWRYTKVEVTEDEWLVAKVK